jgi:hypothetical protein
VWVIRLAPHYYSGEGDWLYAAWLLLQLFYPKLKDLTLKSQGQSPSLPFLLTGYYIICSQVPIKSI